MMLKFLLLYTCTLCFCLAAYYTSKRWKRLIALGLALWAAASLF